MAYGLMACAAATALVVGSAAPVAAKPFTYTNARFGTSVTFPDEVFTSHAEAPDNGDGLLWMAGDGASLAIYGANNALEQTPKQMADFVSKGLDVSYRKIGRDWLVVSGHDGSDIFYQRIEFGRDGVLHAFLLKYPAKTKAKYDPLVRGIADSLTGP